MRIPHPRAAAGRVAAALALAAVFVTALTGVDTSALRLAAGVEAWPLLLVALVLAACVVPLRALAWRPFVARLDPGSRPAARSLLAPMAVSSFLNGLLPARMGEAARVTLASRRLGIGIAPLAGSVLADAFASLIGWAILATVVATVTMVPGLAWGAVGVAWAIAGAGFLASLLVTRRKQAAWPERGGRIRSVLRGVWHGLAEGAGALRDVRATMPAIGPCVAAWAVQLAVVAVLLEIFLPGPAGPAVAVTVFILFSAAQAFPVLPGGIGTTQAAVMAPLVGVFGAPAGASLTVAILLPLVLWLPVALIGWFMGTRDVLVSRDHDSRSASMARVPR